MADKTKQKNKKSKKKNAKNEGADSRPLVASADPTSPAGMSIVALAAELENEHGVPRYEVTKMGHAQRVDAVVEQRAAREAEQADAIEHAEGLDFNEVAVAPNDYFGGPTPEAELDPDELMAELQSARDESSDEAPVGGTRLITDPATYDYVFDGHAGAGPSASSRWMSCTASLQASREFLETLTPNQQAAFAGANTAARQGTTAHAAAEVEARVSLGEMERGEADHALLELSINPEDGENYDDEMGEYITEYVDLVTTYAVERGVDHVLVETRVVAAVPLTGMQEGEVYEIPGSADFISLPTGNVGQQSLVVGDLKYGNGIWVGVDENSQAMIYALGALALMVDDEGRLPEWLEEVVMHIIQPRMDGVKTATITVDALLTWRDEVLAPALTAALYGVDEGGATFVPSEGACQFCPARGGCPALAESRVAAAADLFEEVMDAEFTNGLGSFPETTTLSNQRLGELLVQASGLIDLHKNLKAESERRLFRGEQVPGFHLVNYTPSRSWKDDNPLLSLAGVLTDEQVADLTKPSLPVTPTQAEKILGKEGYETITGLVEKPDKRPVVAKDGDRRKPWEGKPPEAMFEIEEEV